MFNQNAQKRELAIARLKALGEPTYPFVNRTHSDHISHNSQSNYTSVGQKPVEETLTTQQLLLEPPSSIAKPIIRLAIVGLIAVLGSIWLARPSAIVAQVATPAVGATAQTPGVATQSDSSGNVVVVDVEGDVDRPGLQRLPVGSRVADAIAAAGGLRKQGELGAINLAARLEDGQLLVIGAVALDGGTVDTRVSLNKGTLSDLDSLPGVGPVLAGRIISWREKNQRFSSIDELREVPGIGPKLFDNISSLIKL
ncbi:MAG: hypothetical protein F2839_03935 [Actinobacteria bacterium]|uniref:Unannotated protein n=1 Tax=freshwater metagenome TaxID=449393 RepID=A0A6J5Z6H9_9ZZZZ|nr:hypothetical protein [Actinomycetota bacterium]